MPVKQTAKKYGAKTTPIDLSGHFNFPRRGAKDEWWRKLADAVREYAVDDQQAWGIPFKMAGESGPRAICLTKGNRESIIPLSGKADFLCILHNWHQMPDDIHWDDPSEGLVVGEYVLTYEDGGTHVQPIRARFEVGMAESPGPAWLAVPFAMNETFDPSNPPRDRTLGHAQTGVRPMHGSPLLYALPNPNPQKRIKSLTIRVLNTSPLVVAGLTLYSGADHPLKHLPRRSYRVNAGAGPVKVEKAEVDMGMVARIEHSQGARNKKWLESPVVGLTQAPETEANPEDFIEALGAPDATVSVTLEGAKKPLKFSLGEAFHEGTSVSGEAKLEVLGKRRQWMQVRVIDTSTGKPTPVRIHFSGSRGEYWAPYGHHYQINPNWFEDYGADVVAGGRQYAYVHGEFPTDMPVGDVYVEINKGFEYTPVRKKVTIKPGQEVLELEIERWKDLRREGWVTADTHVHFISPHTAWLEAQAEGVNVVNLLASQWGRLFTNVGDYIGRVGIAENDTIVYVGTENRNHMLGHMSMLGTQGQPVYPMCCGGPSESFVGDPDYMTLAEWALENKRKGGVVIRPHYPYCGHTEDPVPIIKGLVDALELPLQRDFPVQEWYRYLNCGYRVACCGGTDKMGAYTPLGWMRTYAKINTDEPFTYDKWAEAVRAGRTISTNGPLMDLMVEGRGIGDSIRMPANGGTLEVQATAKCAWPLGRLEVVHNGKVVASQEAEQGARDLTIKAKIRVSGSGWIAARCKGLEGHPAGLTAAHTSPVYVKCGETRAFSGPAAEHMLALVEGGMEYLNTLATVFDEASRKRMLKMFKEVQEDLKVRLVVEGGHAHHHGDGQYHTHGHGEPAV